MRFRPPEPSFSGISSTKSGFLCSFTKLDVGVGGLSRRKRHRCTCVAYTTADATAVAPAQPLCQLPLLAVAPAQPILPLTLPPLHLRSRFTCGTASVAEPLHLRSRRICAAAVPSAVACSRLPPVLAVAPAQQILPQPTTVAPVGACGLWYHSGLGGGVEDVVD